MYFSRISVVTWLLQTLTNSSLKCTSSNKSALSGKLLNNEATMAGINS